MKNDTFITAHSGCDGTLQNSWSYISHALDKPFDYIEFDIRRNDDGKLVLAHDPEAARSGMLLDEALNMIAPTDKRINFDLKEYFLEEDIISLCENLRERKKATAILNQLLRSGTGIGANIHEANYASSKADFINKFQIALKECYETDYWLDIFHNAGIITDEEYVVMFAQCRKSGSFLSHPSQRQRIPSQRISSIDHSSRVVTTD